MTAAYPYTIWEPGATIGVLGGGQLGRMFAMAARRMGYRIRVVDPDPHPPAAAVADEHLCGSVADPDVRRRLIASVDLVTYEFEHLPTEAVQELSQHRPVYPGPEVLRIAQHRILEKQFLAAAGIPTARFWPIRSEQDIQAALSQIGTPAVLKAARHGYDGKGQVRVDQPDQAVEAFQQLRTSEAVWEAWVDFHTEFSVIVARNLRGQMVTFPAVRNWHRRHILDVSVAPAGLPEEATRQAEAIAQSIAQHFRLVGLICVEYFYTEDHQVLVNEIAPRPHNSGHLTIEAAVTSQFEQHLRAICNLPLGTTQLRCPAAMANLLGELWIPQAPRFSLVCGIPGVYLHLYGKRGATVGRKMGHLTAIGTSPAQALRRVRRARHLLQKSACDTTPY
ncbi:MAG: N5-carboxyaminoimidazole ribonucleotide synthase [Pirellulaceae bacterium]|nr:MAG: N5-carboxyaminoimidazole ribonucleotide synthase [Pirellulaceae bacterium]